MPSTGRPLLIIWRATWYTTCFIFALFCALRMYRYQNRSYFVKRRLLLTALEVVSITIPLGLSALNQWLHLAYPPQYHDLFTSILVSGLGYFFFWIFFNVFVSRVFYLQYDQNFREATLNHAWKEKLDLLSDGSRDWYLDHASTWGNLTWLVKRATVLGVFVVSSFVALVLFGGIHQEILFPFFMAIFFVVGLMVVLRSWCRLPVESDRIFLRQELVLSIVYVVLFLLYLPTIRTLFCLGEQEYTGHWTCYLTDVVVFGLQSFDVFLCTLFVIWRNEKVIEEARARKEAARPQMRADQPSYQMWTEYACTGNKHHFEKFARLLAEEFAIENLLFITEYMQFKTLCEQRIRHVLNDNSIGFFITIPQDVMPVVDKLPDVDEKEKIKMYGQRFYEKYIDVYKAPQQINISYSARVSLEEIFGVRGSPSVSTFGNGYLGRLINDSGPVIPSRTDDGDITSVSVHDLSEEREILRCYDASAKEVARLLTDSFMRFQGYGLGMDD